MPEATSNPGELSQPPRLKEAPRLRGSTERGFNAPLEPQVTQFGKAVKRCRNYTVRPSLLFTEVSHVNALRDGTKLACSYVTGKECQLCERDSMPCRY